MNVLLDSSTLINLINSGALVHVLSLKGFTFFVGTYVEGECFDKDQGDLIEKIIAEGYINRATESVLISEFITLKKQINLGEGETECILLAQKEKSYTIACDDRSARKKASALIGEDRIIGSLYLLRELYRNDVLSCDEVKAYYASMLLNGGFLPPLGEDYFCTKAQLIDSGNS